MPVDRTLRTKSGQLQVVGRSILCHILYHIPGRNPAFYWLLGSKLNHRTHLKWHISKFNLELTFLNLLFEPLQCHFVVARQQVDM